MQETVFVANSYEYKYMYENCADGLLDALVIVQYMHVLYSDGKYSEYFYSE